MIRKFFNKNILNTQPSKSVVSSAFIITIASLLSRLLGLVRDRFLASTFGAGDTLDVYYAAFRIPDLIYNLLILGALSAAFIPVFTSLVSREKEDEAWKLANGILNLAISCIILISAIFAFFAPYLMKIITPGFSGEKLEMVVMFTRIMFLSPLFLGISGIFGGVLTSFKRFIIYSFAPILYNIGIIIGVLFLVKFMGPVGLAWGVVLGAFLHVCIQYPAAKFLGFKYHFNLIESLKNPDVKKVLRLMIPRTLGIAVNQFNLLIITVFASMLAAGSLTIFNFAQNLQGVAVGLFGSSFAIAVFPILSALAAKNEKKEFVENFSKTFRQILFFVIPISVLILVLRAQIVRVVLGAGKFDWQDTILTFNCLGIFALSLFAQSTIPLLARSFYALHNTKTPFYIALATEAINICLVLLLMNRFGIIGLTIAFSVANVFQMFVLMMALRSNFDSLDDKNTLKSIAKIGLAAFCAGTVTQLIKYFVDSITDIDTFLGIASQLIFSAAGGILIFVAICHLLKSEEYFSFKESLMRKLFKGKGNIKEDISEASGI